MTVRRAGGSRPVRRADPHGLEPELAASADAAHAAALRLLEARARTRLELEQRLEQRGFEARAVAAALDRLAEVGLVDDWAFARDLAARRAAQGVDAPRIALDLRERGVDREMAVQAADETVAASERAERCRETAEARLSKLQGLSPEAQFRRLAAYLARRGYPGEIVENVVNELVDLERS